MTSLDQGIQCKHLHVKLPGEELQEFPVANWRKAFQRFLEGVWSQHIPGIDAQLNLGLSHSGILLYVQEDGYHLSHSPFHFGIQGTELPQFERREILAVPHSRQELEVGLARFLRNNHIRQLVIEFYDARLMIYKGVNRTELSAVVTDRTF